MACSAGARPEFTATWNIPCTHDPSQQLGDEHDAGHNGAANLAKHSKNILAKIS
jgi:hypothetical protein